MTNLETAMQVIKDNYDAARCGIFCTANTVGDAVDTLYSANGLKIVVCYEYEYFEVFGLTDSEFRVLCDYYALLGIKKQ